MKRYVGTVMNSFVDINNVQLTDEVIKEVLNDQPAVPVTINFSGQPIGRAIKFFQTEDQLSCEVEIDETRFPLIERAYLVPGMDNVEFHNEGRTRVIDKGDLTELSISLLPANTRLSPITLKGSK